MSKEPTILHFIYIKNETIKLNNHIAYITWSSIENKITLDNNNEAKLNIALNETSIYYNELIEIYFNNNSILPDISFDYPIYLNKTNIIYIDNIFPQKDEKSDNEKCLLSLEIIFQSIENEFLPKKIIYNDIELFSFDTFKNKLRKRIGLINIDINELNMFSEIKKNYPDFNFVENNSYQILLKIPLDRNIQYTIANSNNYNECKKETKPIFIDKKNSCDSLLEFKKDFNIFIKNCCCLEKIEEDEIEKLIDKYKALNITKYYYENALKYSSFESVDLEIFNLMFYYLELIKLSELIKDKHWKLNLTDKLSEIQEFHELYENSVIQVKNMSVDIKDKVFIIKSYNNKFIESFSTGNYIENICVINIKDEENKFNPYIKAIDFIKEIILNLKEESRLFEVFLYLDSEVIENLLIKREESFVKPGNNKIINYSKNPTEYGVNMSNIDEVRDHLLKLIPKYIIRLDSELKFNANYDPSSKIMTVNEKQLFKIKWKTLNKLFSKNESNDHYVLPITIEILHEIYGHGKKRFLNDKEKSPEEYRDSKYNYIRKNITKKIKIQDFNSIVYPESGVVLEKYISENRKIINWMRRVHDKNEEEKILDVSLWVDKDFEKLEKTVKNFIDSDKNNDYDYGKYEVSSSSNDEDYLDSDNETCGFHKYN